jgi:hypothetical protein
MKTTMHLRLPALAGAFLMLLGSCATAPKRAESTPPRTKDSPAEKIAAQRAAAPKSLELEQNDERWQIDAARERRREQDAQKAKAAQQQTDGANRVDVTPSR